ncbi:glycosyltransferase family 2 protein [Nocardioides mesophilus]|uniref:Glycosyltransferase family 2 protein n=1 Tax=Nocardioides mesophilus TaxID=433659 RepID=A0A7G9RDJ8_9ACTN|nr:glycosyltransferase family 2 protein [Nocardioides mesophilus]QNN53673.1 glycosyltransferase family 2 protein [Nocardioides mesophilus]
MPLPLDTPRRILAVLPAFNEEASLAATIDELRRTCPDVDVLVIDDGSADATAQVARRSGAAVCQLPFNLGVGGAMRTGFRYAMRHDYDVVVQVDADGQHDPAYLGVLVAALDHADVVVGARFAGEGSYAARGPRRWAMRLLAVTLSRLAHTRLTDVTSGFRAANRRAIRIFAAHYPAEYLGDTVESLVIAVRVGLVVRQQPVSMRQRAGGTASQTPLRAAAYLARAMIALAIALVRRWPTTLEPTPTEAL